MLDRYTKPAPERITIIDWLVFLVGFSLIVLAMGVVGL